MQEKSQSKTEQNKAEQRNTHTQTTTRKTVAVVNFIYKAVDVNDNVDAASCAAFNEFLCMRRETKINEKLQPKKVRERERERRSSVSAKESGRNEVQRANTEREQQGERVGERSRASVV